MAIMIQIFVIQSSLDMIRNYIVHPFDCRFKIPYMQKVRLLICEMWRSSGFSIRPSALCVARYMYM